MGGRILRQLAIAYTSLSNTSERRAFSISPLEEQRAVVQRVAVLGTMLELGSASDELHRDVLADALERDIDLVVATGAFGVAAEQLGQVGSNRVITSDDWSDAYPEMRARLKGDEIVLLKASRGVALEGIVALLESDFSAMPGAPTVEA